jgi:hypothetical protein
MSYNGYWILTITVNLNDGALIGLIKSECLESDNSILGTFTMTPNDMASCINL